ncbi:MAG: hypothetical protein LBT43_00550 [Prevotella sp.]|jgi:hypothetical protein|nr:hypothetical protein [Prevotella sp.]
MKKKGFVIVLIVIACGLNACNHNQADPFNHEQFYTYRYLGDEREQDTWGIQVRDLMGQYG